MKKEFMDGLSKNQDATMLIGGIVVFGVVIKNYFPIRRYYVPLVFYPRFHPITSIVLKKENKQENLERPKKMPSKRISLTITEICQKLGINYQSCNPDYLVMINDAKRLGEIILELKILAGDLIGIAERHDIDGLKGILTKEALEISKVDHDLVKLATRIQKEK